MKEQLAQIEELQELSDSQKVDYMKLEAQIKLKRDITNLLSKRAD